MAATPFTTDADLVKKRANILELGVSAFPDQHLETARIILRDLKLWYETEAQRRGIDAKDTPIDQALFLESDEEITPAATLLALSLCYDYLAKDLPIQNDGFKSQSLDYQKKFKDDWAACMLNGFSYDWDSSGSIDANERAIYEPRRLERC